MDSEINCLNENETWKIVDRPENKKIIDVKWVYKIKSDNTCKARLVVCRFQQKENLENVFPSWKKCKLLKFYVFIA